MFKHIFLCTTSTSVTMCPFSKYTSLPKKTLEPIVYLFLFFSSSRMTHLSQLSKPGKKGFKVVLVLVGRQVSSDSLVGVDRRQQRRNGSKDTLHCDALVCSYSMQPGLRAACPCAWLPIYFAPNCSTSALHWSLQKVFQSNASHFTVHADGTSVQV